MSLGHGPAIRHPNQEAMVQVLLRSSSLAGVTTQRTSRIPLDLASRSRLVHIISGIPAEKALVSVHRRYLAWNLTRTSRRQPPQRDSRADVDMCGSLSFDTRYHGCMNVCCNVVPARYML